MFHLLLKKLLKDEPSAIEQISCSNPQCINKPQLINCPTIIPKLNEDLKTLQNILLHYEQNITYSCPEKV